MFLLELQWHIVSPGIFLKRQQACDTSAEECLRSTRNLLSHAVTPYLSRSVMMSVLTLASEHRRGNLTRGSIRMNATPIYRIRYWFEWGAGCLWSADDMTRQRFGYDIIENKRFLTEIAGDAGMIEMREESSHDDRGSGADTGSVDECMHSGYLVRLAGASSMAAGESYGCVPAQWNGLLRSHPRQCGLAESPTGPADASESLL